MRRADYDVVRITPEFVVVRDTGGDGPVPSVTNDAENVVREVLSTYGEGRRILYYDSDGELDELVHDGRRFTGFAAWRAPLPE